MSSILHAPTKASGDTHAGDTIVEDVLVGQLRVRLGPAVTMTSDQFFAFCQQNEELRLERSANGDLIIMPPAGGESSYRNLAIASQVFTWAEKRGAGRTYDSSVGFELPNGATFGPDTSWITDEQFASLSPEQRERFLPLCPFFVVEVLSPSDSLRQTQDKMQEYLDNGAQLGWLIDPYRKQAYVYRPGRPVAVVDMPSTLAGDPELPGLVVGLASIWAR